MTDEYWERDYRQRCRDIGAPALVLGFTRAELVERYGDECAHCGDADWRLDHKIPIAAGGVHSIDNCQPLCRRCNGRKAVTADRVTIDVYNGVQIPLEGWKRCTVCNQTKELADFYTAGPGRGVRGECVPCTLSYKAEFHRTRNSSIGAV